MALVENGIAQIGEHTEKQRLRSIISEWTISPSVNQSDTFILLLPLDVRANLFHHAAENQVHRTI